MRAVAVTILLLLVAACGSAQARRATSPVAQVSSSPSAATTPTAVASAARSPRPGPTVGPQPTPKTSPTLLFAVLEANGTANTWTYNTVAIAGLDGYARAKTTFTPVPTPNLGCIGGVLPQSAHVAAGKVFYSDAKGVVRSLGIDGTITVAATFPITSTQQMLSFAVSPDGLRILGTILTIPNNAAMACGGSPSTGAFTFDAYAAASGQAVQLLYHQTFGQAPNVIALTGWDALGPIGTYPTVWASQGGGPGSTLGTFVRIDPTTLKVVAPFSNPSSCRVWDSVQSGAFVCMPAGKPTSSDPYAPIAQPVSIRNAAGQEEWHFTVTSVNGAWAPHLAADEQHAVICCDFDTSSVWLVDRQGHQVFLRSGFYDSGWLDATTVVGSTGQTASSPDGTLAYVALNAPGTYVSLGFSGSVVGTVRN
jgi:hypothetical protein